MSEIIESIQEHKERVQYSFAAGYIIKTNKQAVKLLIDDEQSCCESWGYFWSNDNPQDFVGAELLGVAIVDTALNQKKIEDLESLDQGGVMFVNLDTNNGLLQFVAYNSHNGYYGHSAYVFSEQLTHECGL